MKELLDDLDRWRADGRRIAMARVVDIDGSSPRLPGAAMAVNDLGEVIGSVSGGCVEGAVVAEALAVLAGERLAGIVSFGFSDGEALAVGLMCGGTIHLFIEEAGLCPSSAALVTALRSDNPVALVTVVAGPNVGAKLLVSHPVATLGTLGDSELDRVAGRDALAELDVGHSGIRHYGPTGQTAPQDLAGDDDEPVTVTVFIECWTAPPAMWIFGAVDFTAALASVAKLLGFRVTVCDARSVFATRRRFPVADEVRVGWPGPLFAERGDTLGSRDAVCILTHDPKFDVPAVVGALATKVGYIGVLGSRTTHQHRLMRLAEVGVTDPSDLNRLMSPVGIDIGARTPEETAISICAEIIAGRTGHTVPSLRDGRGTIHR